MDGCVNGLSRNQTKVNSAVVNSNIFTYKYFYLIKFKKLICFKMLFKYYLNLKQAFKINFKIRSEFDSQGPKKTSNVMIDNEVVANLLIK